MSVVNLSKPEQFIGGANYHGTISPDIAVSLGRDVLDLSTLQPEAFFNPPITSDLASQPLFYQRIKMAWLSLVIPKPNITVLNPELEQTARLTAHADMVDKAFNMETNNRYVFIYSPRAVLLPHVDLGLVSVNTELIGSAKLSWLDHETGTVFDETEMVPGDITEINGNYTYSVANTSLDSRIVLAQLLPTVEFHKK